MVSHGPSLRIGSSVWSMRAMGTTNRPRASALLVSLEGLPSLQCLPALQVVLPSAVRIVSGTGSDATHLTTPLPPSCSAHITGTGDGRLFFFDLLHSAAALGQMDAQHDGNASLRSVLSQAALAVV